MPLCPARYDTLPPFLLPSSVSSSPCACALLPQGWTASVLASDQRCDDVDHAGWCGKVTVVDAVSVQAEAVQNNLCSYSTQLVSDEDTAVSSDGIGPYAANEVCVQRFTAPHGKFVKIEFLTFDTEHEFDRLHVSWEALAAGTALELSGQLLPSQTSVVSADNTLEIRFSSDGSTQLDG